MAKEATLKILFFPLISCLLLFSVLRQVMRCDRHIVILKIMADLLLNLNVFLFPPVSKGKIRLKV